MKLSHLILIKKSQILHFNKLSVTEFGIFILDYYDYSISEILNVFTIPLLAIGIEARLITISPV